MESLLIQTYILFGVDWLRNSEQGMHNCVTEYIQIDCAHFSHLS